MSSRRVSTVQIIGLAMGMLAFPSERILSYHDGERHSHRLMYDKGYNNEPSLSYNTCNGVLHLEYNS